MGYIIPVQPIQSQIYANRLLIDDYNFAFINKVEGVRKTSLLAQHIMESESLLEKGDDNPFCTPLFHPNPYNLSPIIAEISGKGNYINMYI